MALKKMARHLEDSKPPKDSIKDWMRSTIHVESTDPEARVHPHPKTDMILEKHTLRLVPADEEERSEAAIDGAFGHKVADDES